MEILIYSIEQQMFIQNTFGMHECEISAIIKEEKSHYYPCRIFYATTAPNQNTALSSCFHSFKRVPPRAQQPSNKVILQ